MYRIKWNDKYSTGNVEIDKQHMQLFEIFNEYLAEKKKRSSLKYLILSIDLLGYCQEHFKTEEQLMLSANYPFFEEHKSEHANIYAAVENLVNKVYNGDSIDDVAADEFLFSWVEQHIVKKDCDVIEWINNGRI
ncbi:bacteriohemerythrin [Maridesulfovibrio zosterae]|uniref:bacteriohemerythrin n=1 Tax=Maridesulfovibrio zosterae TaxID=82171 RepID=UPI000423ED2F|nr:hemerythrin family protein [Maridesulfovibrio zosterae]